MFKGLAVSALLARLAVAALVGLLVAVILGMFDVTAESASLIGLIVAALVFLGVVNV